MSPISTKGLALSALLLVALCLMPIPTPTGSPLPWNQLLLQAIPLPVALLMLLVPFTMHRSLVVQQQVKINDRIRQELKSREEKAQGHLVFGSRFRENSEGGTSWEFTNKNAFPWTQCVLLIEKEIQGEKKTEKHHLGLFHGKQKVRIESDLTTSSTAQWRVMAITDQGKVIDFPDLWVDISPNMPLLQKTG